MSWRPVVTGNAQDAVVAAIAGIVEELASARSRYSDDACDLALVHGYLAGSDDAMAAAIDAAVAFPPTGSLKLFGGSPRIGWTIAHLADRETADEACAPIDARLADRLAGEWNDHLDPVWGICGIGIYALERADTALVARIVDHLVRLAQPRRGGLAWFTPVERVPEGQRAGVPAGYWNLGLAHGTPGILAFAARAGAATLVTGAATYVDSLPYGLEWELEGRDTPASRRLAWCYGDLGTAVALAAAAQVDGRWRAPALARALDCASRTPAEASITDAAFCHGAAGIAHLFHRLHYALGDDRLADASRAWVGHTLALRHTVTAADPSLLTGLAGVALALHAAISDVEPRWDRLLLADIG